MWNIKRETESLLIAAQNNDIRNNSFKVKVDKKQQNIWHSLCRERDETINRIVSEWCIILLKKLIWILTMLPNGICTIQRGVYSWRNG